MAFSIGATDDSHDLVHDAMTRDAELGELARQGQHPLPPATGPTESELEAGADIDAAIQAGRDVFLDRHLQVFVPVLHDPLEPLHHLG
jgi:hypothetical protein